MPLTIIDKNYQPALMDKDILLIPTNRDADALLVSIDRIALPILENKDILLAIIDK